MLLLRIPMLLLQAEGYYVARGLSFRYPPAVASLRVLMSCTLPWICTAMHSYHRQLYHTPAPGHVWDCILL